MSSSTLPARWLSGPGCRHTNSSAYPHPPPPACREPQHQCDSASPAAPWWRGTVAGREERWRGGCEHRGERTGGGTRVHGECSEVEAHLQEQPSLVLRARVATARRRHRLDQVQRLRHHLQLQPPRRPAACARRWHPRDAPPRPHLRAHRPQLPARSTCAGRRTGHSPKPAPQRRCGRARARSSARTEPAPRPCGAGTRRGPGRPRSPPPPPPPPPPRPPRPHPRRPWAPLRPTPPPQRSIPRAGTGPASL